jgi:hypothetical protein
LFTAVEGKSYNSNEEDDTANNNASNGSSFKTLFILKYANTAFFAFIVLIITRFSLVAEVFF